MKLTEAIQLTESLPSRAEGVMDPMGLGSIPINTNIDYLGIKAKMTPYDFLNLAFDLRGRHQQESIDYIIDHLKSGGKIAPPLLELQPSREDSGYERDGSLPVVVSHEGRHRMIALSSLYGDSTFVEIHIVIKGFRRHEISDDMIRRLNIRGIENQDRNDVVIYAVRDAK